MSIDEKVNEKSSKGNGLLKAFGGLGLLLHSAFHIIPLVGFGYLALGGGTGLAHSRESETGIWHYALDFMGAGFAIWGIYYAYHGIKEYFQHRKHGHNGYVADYSN